MPVTKPDYQLQLPLDMDEEAPSDQPLVVSPEEARLRAETARTALEGRTDLKWMEEYARLRDGNWPWRVAAYIAWASSPKVSRFPKTQDELARKYLGLTSDRSIATWRKKNPAIDEMVAILQASPLWDFRAEVFLELTSDYVPTSKLAAMLTKGSMTKNDLKEMSDSELAALSRTLLEELAEKEEKKAGN